MVDRCSVCEQSLSYSREVEQDGVEYKLAQNVLLMPECTFFIKQ